MTDVSRLADELGTDEDTVVRAIAFNQAQLRRKVLAKSKRRAANKQARVQRRRSR